MKKKSAEGGASHPGPACRLTAEYASNRRFFIWASVSSWDSDHNQSCGARSCADFHPHSRGTTVLNARLSICMTQALSLLFVQSGCTLGMCTEVPSKVPAGSNKVRKALRCFPTADCLVSITQMETKTIMHAGKYGTGKH